MPTPRDSDLFSCVGGLLAEGLANQSGGDERYTDIDSDSDDEGEA